MAKRNAANYLQRTYSTSERRACRVIQIDRSSKRRQPKAQTDKELLARLHERSNRFPRFGYRKIHIKLVEFGITVSRERTRLLRRQEGLSLSVKRPRRRRVGESQGIVNQAMYPNHVWTYDFMSDQTEDGRTLKYLTIVDEFTRSGRRIYCARSITSGSVIEQLELLTNFYGVPDYIRSDNGPELIAHALKKWLANKGIKTQYIDPGCPWQNAYGEGFNAIFRDGCLDRWLFTSPKQAQQIADQWLDEYNDERPHGGLGMLTPNEFEKRFHHQQAC